MKKLIVFDHAVMVHKILNEQCLEDLKHEFTKISHDIPNNIRGEESVTLFKK